MFPQASLFDTPPDSPCAALVGVSGFLYPPTRLSDGLMVEPGSFGAWMPL
jgi:hypothetical protein